MPIVERLARVWLAVTPLLVGVLAGGESEWTWLVALMLWIGSTVYWLVVPAAVQHWVRPPDPRWGWDWIRQAVDRDTPEFFLRLSALHLVCFAVAYAALAVGALGGYLTGAAVCGSAGAVLGLAILPALRRQTFRDFFTLYGFGLIGFGAGFLLAVVVMMVVTVAFFTPKTDPQGRILLFLIWIVGTLGAAIGVTGKMYAMGTQGTRSALRLAAIAVLVLVVLAGGITLVWATTSSPPILSS